MSEFLSQPDPEQLMLGGLLAIIIDKNLDFAPGDFEDHDTSEAIGDMMTALYAEGEDAESVLVEYGVLENEVGDEV